MSLQYEILHLIRQFCDEEKFTRTLHTLEEEAGFHFDKKYFEELVMNGKWDEAEKYLSAFTTIDGNEYSGKTYFEMRKQKLMEGFEKNDVGKGLEILLKDLKFLAASHADVYKEMTTLLTMDDLRKHNSLGYRGDTLSGRKRVLDEINPLIEANPHINKKLEVPDLGGESKLKGLVNQSLSAQLNQPNQSSTPMENPIALPMPPSLLQPGNSSAAVVRRPRSIRNHHASSVAMGVIRNSQNAPTNIGSSMSVDKVIGRMVSSQSSKVADVMEAVPMIWDDLPRDIPNSVQRCIGMRSPPTTMDFHPLKETLLLVGTLTGDVELWNVCAEQKVFWNSFTIWKPEAMSMLFLNNLKHDPQISVKRVKWSPYGSIFGVAFSKNIVQLYSFNAMTTYVEKHLEIEAHSGSVNDIAFGRPINQVVMITCGNDMIVKMWNTLNGTKLSTLEAHTAPVYSLTPHVKEGIHFVFSTSINGEIKAWVYDEIAPKIVYEAPDHSCVKMVYNSAAGERLFSCGTSNNGDSHLVEWNETEGFMTRAYQGLSRGNGISSPLGIAQIGTTKNRFLLVGDDHKLKVWDMNNVQVLGTVAADQNLPAKPYLCFNKSGDLLAVSAEEGIKIKVLANEAGTQMLTDSTLSSIIDISVLLSRPLVKEMQMTMRPWELSKLLNSRRCSRVFQVSRCLSLRLPASETKSPLNQVYRLAYTHSGNGILALTANGTHTLWKWSSGNVFISFSFGTATASQAPRVWKPRGDLAMKNEVGDDAPSRQEAHFFAISKNDSYVVTTSGKAVSLFNMITFERMRSCQDPPPSATCVAFHPADNNIIAIGLEDSSILIYNVRLAKPTYKLSGHKERISGLAFCSTLRALISAAIDAEIMTWDANAWQQKRSTSLQMPVGWLPSDTAQTTIQIHRDQRHFLAVHDTQLALYEAANLRCITQWTTGNNCARISNGIFACDCKIVYTVMKDGSVMAFSSPDLTPRLVFDPAVYLPPTTSPSSAYPLVVAAHPQKPNQFALGMSDGGVTVIEPREHGGRWAVPGSPPLLGNGGLGKNRIIID